MAFVPAPDCAKVVLVYNMESQVYVNTLWFKKTGSWGTGEMEDLADKVRYWWATTMLGLYPDVLELVDIVVYDMRAVDAPVIHVTTDLPVAGTNISDPMAANAAAVISFRTSGRGRSSRGRIYIGPLAEDGSDEGLFLATTTHAALVVGADAIADIGTGISWQHVVVSFHLDNVARSEGYAQAVTTYLVDTKLDSQRRRLAGRGT